jgi:hypothetical protein
VAGPGSDTDQGDTETQRLKEQIRQWKAGMEEANRFTLEEARNRKPAERFANHQRFLEGHGSYGLACSKQSDYAHRTPYHEIQERWLARHPQRLLGH